MALVVADRVKETTTSVGTSTINLAGAEDNFETFVAGVGTGNTTYYAIVDKGNSEFEVGIGTVTSGTPDTLSRDTVLASSNSDALVNFSTGEKDVLCTQPADKAVYLDSSGQLVIDGTSVTATATELNYVDGVTSAIQTQLDSKLNLSGGTMTGALTLSGAPTADNHATTKIYVDDLIAAGIHYHDPVRVESPDDAGSLTATYNNGTNGVGATLTNNGTQAALVIDGVTLATSDRVLIYNQTNAFENGIYTVTNTGSASTNWVLTRATDADSYGVDNQSLSEGTSVFVLEGDDGSGEVYACTTTGTITFGTTAINFSQIGRSAVITGDGGITVTGNEISANVNATVQTTGANSVTSTASRTYAVQVDGSNDLVVNVPWVDTDTNTDTTYTAGTGLTLSGTQFSVQDNYVLNSGDSIAGQLSVTSSVYPPLEVTRDAGAVTTGNYGSLKLNTITSGTPAAGLGSYAGFFVDDVIKGSVGFENDGSFHILNASDADIVTVSSAGNITVAGTVDGRDIAADGTKLDGIESGATADQTASEILTAIKTVDGSGSGLDADTVDGFQASSFLKTTDQSVVVATQLTSTSNLNSISDGWYKWSSDNPTNSPFDYAILLQASDPNQKNQLVFGGSGTGNLAVRRADSGTFYDWAYFWNEDNDGAGSGLDADLLDGVQANKFFTSYNNAGTTGWEDSNRNFRINSGGNAAGLAMHESDGTFAFQLYGDGTSYGFLDGNWGAWDIQKQINGQFKVDEGSGLQRVFNDAYHPNADKWTTPRTITLNGDVSGSVSIDGSANVTLTTTVANNSHDHNRLLAVDDRDMKPNTSGVGSGVKGIKAFFSSYGGMTGTANTDYQDVLVIDTYSDTSGGNANAITIDKSDGNMRLWNASQTATSWGSPSLVWTSTNDGSGSGLDADLLDGQQGSYYQVARTALGYVDVATGSYGTIKVDDDRGVTWAGYAIRDDWVLMFNGAERGGIYNDTDNEWAIQCYQNAQVQLYYNGGLVCKTTSGGLDLTVDTTDVLNFTANSTNDARGISFNSRTALSADYNDGWLRLNSSSEFTNGTYSPLKIASAQQLVGGSSSVTSGGQIALRNTTNPYLSWHENATRRAYIQYLTSDNALFIYNEEAGNLRFRGNAAAVNFDFQTTGAANTGRLFVDQDDFAMQHGNGESIVYGRKDSNTWVYYNGQWRLRTNTQGIDVRAETSTYSQIAMTTGANADVRGYLYGNTSNDIGILDSDGNWAYRHRRDTEHEWRINNVQILYLTSSELLLDQGTSSTLTVKCDDGGRALIRANGDSQGTGAIEVGQSGSYGGGISYNGDGSPAFVSGEGSDRITFYRMNAGTRSEVFSYSYASDTVEFNGDIDIPSKIKHVGDTDTYIEFHAADQWRVVTGGGERLEVNNTNTTLATNLVINTHVINMDLNNLADNAIELTDVRSSTWPFEFNTNAVGNDNPSGFWVGSNGYPDMRLRRENSTVRALISSWERSFVSNGFSISGGTLDMNNNDIVGVDQIIHEGDSNTYIQFHAADQWRVVTGGSERLEVNNTNTTVQNNLIVNGNTTLGNALTDTVTVNARDIVLTNGNGDYNRDGTIGFGTTAELFSATSGELPNSDEWDYLNVASIKNKIGNSGLWFNAYDAVGTFLSDARGQYCLMALTYDNGDADDAHWLSGDADRVIGAYIFDGQNHFWHAGNASPLFGNTTVKMKLDNNGRLEASSFTAISDKRLKENLTKIKVTPEELKNIHGYTYNFIEQDENIRNAGILAQEVLEILPEAVSTSTIKNPKGESSEILQVDYNAVIAVLVNVVNELTSRVGELEAKIDSRS